MFNNWIPSSEYRNNLSIGMNSTLISNNGIIYIIGLYGSGQSTLSNQLRVHANQVKHHSPEAVATKIYHVSISDFIYLPNRCMFATEFLKTTNEPIKKCHEILIKQLRQFKDMRFQYLELLVPVFLRYMIFLEEKSKDCLLYVEGTELIPTLHHIGIQHKSVIILGTSIIDSTYRKIKKEGLKGILNFPFYYSINKKLNVLLNDLRGECDEECNY